MLKDELEAIISSDNNWSGRATFTLALGILGEYVVLKLLEHVSVKELRVLFKSPRPTVLTRWTNRCKGILKVLFACMVFAGVAGEYFSSSRIAYNAGRLQRLADEQQNEMEQQVIDTTRLAGNVGDRANKLAALLKIERDTAARFQREATDSETRLVEATNRLDLELKRRGPRHALLHNAFFGSDFRLSPFREQGVIVVTCLGLHPEREFSEAMLAFMGVGHNPVELERNQTADELRVQLFNDARWYVRETTEDCGEMGLRLYVDPESDNRTQWAAVALSLVLHDALLLNDGPEVDPIIWTKFRPFLDGVAG